MRRIYLVEDDQNLNDILSFYLKKEGFEVTGFVNGLSALDQVKDEPDLWVLDIMLPDIDGFDIIRAIKERSDIPVVFISARDADLDRLIGLEMGSDDYIAKPFLPMELVIRCKRLIDRVYGKPQAKGESLKIDGYTLDMDKRKVSGEGGELVLTSKEFDLLQYIRNNRDRALSRDAIINTVWGDDYFGTDRVVDDLVRRVRKKMPRLNIETIYGFGYRWCGDEE